MAQPFTESHTAMRPELGNLATMIIEQHIPSIQPLAKIQRIGGTLNTDLTITDILENKSEQIRLSLKLDLPHPTSQGDHRENTWISFLESFLPSRYAVTKGFVFDSHGGISDQIDVIIYDRHHSPLILESDNGERHVTAESVYAIFEVRSAADETSIRYAQDKINSVRNLHRTSRAMVASGKLVEPREPIDIIGGLLTIESNSEENIRKHLETYDGINVVCAANTMTAFRRATGEVEVSNEQEALPAFFYLLLDELHKLGTVAAIDIRKYAERALKSFRLEGDHHVDK